jgi:CheY-like chemotaxis protein
MRATEILLVDDNPADTDLTSEMLSRNGRPKYIRAGLLAKYIRAGLLAKKSNGSVGRFGE